MVKQNGVEVPPEENRSNIPVNSVNYKSNGDRNEMRFVTFDTYSITSQSQDPRKLTDPESPIYIMEASDPFLNPAIYNRYSICTDIEDTFPERLAKQLENIKDVTRNRAVTSITAGENAVYWLVNTFKYLTSGWFGLVIILVTIMAYGSLGAFMFMALEGPSEEKHRIIDIRKELVNKIENIVRNETIMMLKNPDFLTLLQDDLKVYENNFTEFSKHAQNNDETETTWTFWNSFIFAGTIFTTIGYGHIVPKTIAGRASTIVYAIIGIPLFLIALASFGKFLTRIIKFFWMHIFCYKRAKEVEEVKRVDVYRPASLEDTNYELISSNVERKKEAKREIASSENEIKIDEEFNLPISLALSILIVYMLCGAVIAHIFESWTYFNAFYCIFISMSTIGFGDLVVSDSVRMIYSIVYIIFGLSLTAMCIEVVQKQMTVMFKNACEKFMILVDDVESDNQSDLNDTVVKRK